MFHIEDHIVHGDPPLEDNTARVVQDNARHQAEHQMAVVGVFVMDLAGISVATQNR
jgi:hypothetical protein